MSTEQIPDKALNDYDEALAAMVDHASRIVLGSGLDPATTMGPLVSFEQQRRVGTGAGDGGQPQQRLLPRRSARR